MSSTAARVGPGGDGALVGPAGLDAEAAYRALAARDRRFDGRIWFGVTTTGIYCRPVCPAQTPRQGNVRFFAAPAAAVSAGFRACKRCRPDAAPGSRLWDFRSDLAGRALRLIADGAVDEGGVRGLAAALHVSERHLHRTLVAQVGAGPMQLALSRRAQTARMLVDQTALPLTEIAFAAGFASVRQFNDVVRREFGCAPSELRRTSAPALGADDPMLVLRLRFRPPYDAVALGTFLAARAVAGVERQSPTGDGGWRHERTIPLPAGPAVVSVEPRPDRMLLRVARVQLRDTAALVAAVRRWLDLDADPEAIAQVLAADPYLADPVAARPGLRVPTTVDPWETCVRAVLGQQVSVARARGLLDRLVERFGATIEGAGSPPDTVTRTFPDPAVLAAAGPEALSAIGMPRSRGRTLHALAEGVAGGALSLTGAPREELRAQLLTVPGIGPWTTDYIALRALADPDAFPVTDLGIRHGARRLGLPTEPASLTAHAVRWQPWRAYAAQHLWSLDPQPKEPR